MEQNHAARIARLDRRVVVRCTRARAGSDGALQFRSRLVRSAEGDVRAHHRPEGRVHPPDGRREPRADPRRKGESARRHLPRRGIGVGKAARRRRVCSKRTSRRAWRSSTTGRSASPRRTSISRRRSTPASSDGATTPSSSPRRSCPSPSAGRISSIPPTRTRSRWPTRALRARRSTPCRPSCR